MTMTANGFIAKNDDSTDFVTKAESESYVKNVIDAGAMIIGRRTYEILSTQPEFQEFLKANVKIIVVSHNDFKLANASHAVVHSPQEALALAKDFEKVIVAGGGILDAAFLESDLIDEMYLDIEPALLGKGIPLFNGGDFEKKLKLLGSKNFGENEIQLHYQVIKD